MKLTPRIEATFHAANVVLWLAMIPVALLTGLKTSVPFLVLISLLALVYSEAGAWQAARAERRLDKNDEYGND